MKTASVLFVTALFLMAIPLSAAAYGGDRHDGGAKHYKGQHEDRHGSDRYRHGRDHKWGWQAKKHHKRHLHEPRRNHRYAVQRYNPRPYYAESAVLLGFPRIVFHLGW
jgi:hypothetical protein